MVHTLKALECGTEDQTYEISIFELDPKTVNITVNKIDFVNQHLNNSQCINLTKDELHSLIGTLLHVQAKMKGGK